MIYSSAGSPNLERESGTMPPLSSAGPGPGSSRPPDGVAGAV